MTEFTQTAKLFKLFRRLPSTFTGVGTGIVTGIVIGTVLLPALVLNLITPALALKLPASLKSSLQDTLSVDRFRLDGAVETEKGALYLPLLPLTGKINEKKISLKASFPSQDVPDFLLFSNGWCYLKVLLTGHEQTVLSLEDLPAELQKALLSTRFPPDLIVPEHFVLPPSLKPIAGTIAIAIKQPSTNHANKPSQSEELTRGSVAVKTGERSDAHVSKEGCILVTSPATGKVSLLSFPELIKIIEFPTEGTPSGVAYAAGKVYIADQSKGRILKLDPYHKIFLGQINLPKRSTPKDVAALPSGKLIYVSESLFNDIAVIEADADKLLLRTKVNCYPGRMAITPNGNLLLALSVPDGKVSLLSTRDQRYLGVIKVGSLPNGIAISADSHMAYVSNRVSNTVSVLDLVHQTVVNNINTGAGPTGVAVDSDNGKLYVANAKDNSIGIYNLKTYSKMQEIKLPMDLDFPGSLTLLPDKQHILVSSESTDAVGLLNTESGTFEKIASVGHNSDLCLWIPAQE